MLVLFCQPVFSIFEFYDSDYALFFSTEYNKSISGTNSGLPTNFGIADVTGKHRYSLDLDACNNSFF